VVRILVLQCITQNVTQLKLFIQGTLNVTVIDINDFKH
jgi:hypothetical protein